MVRKNFQLDFPVLCALRNVKNLIGYNLKVGELAFKRQTNTTAVDFMIDTLWPELETFLGLERTNITQRRTALSSYLEQNRKEHTPGELNAIEDYLNSHRPDPPGNLAYLQSHHL